MSDPLRTDITRDLDAMSAAERDVKIEQLLLLGLDRYFAQQYDQAINVWTRALFLDRAHPRARAYIDRARSALAERQRESEELLHNGVDAFRRGDTEQARELLLAAIDRGAPSDEASALLDRLTRLEAASASRAGRASTRTAVHVAPERPDARRSAAAWAGSALVLAVIAAGVFAAIGWPRLATLMSETNVARRTPAAHEPLPAPPRRGEIAMGRARTLAANGHLHDALASLDGVRPTDPQYPEADRFRAEIQRELLALAPVPASLPTREKGSRALP